MKPLVEEAMRVGSQLQKGSARPINREVRYFSRASEGSAEDASLEKALGVTQGELSVLMTILPLSNMERTLVPEPQ